MQQVSEDSAGKIRLTPGSLYIAVKQLKDDGLIEEVPNADARRRYYQLTQKGRDRLESELEYFSRTLELAKQRKAFETFAGA
jgi:DNA-binding PadR family transcriptional regulator